MSDEFALTIKQDEAMDLLTGEARNIMLYGGSRSGKTFLLCWAIIARAVNCDESKHCVLRLNFNAAKRSLWLGTFPKVFKIAYPDMPYKSNGTDYYYTLPNNSEIWIGGLDNKERTEKILGNEYSTMYFNECSQLDYKSIQLGRTRLAEDNHLIKKTYYDQNPPKKTHWSYWLFERGIDPIDEEVLKKPQNYSALLMNPMDNMDNIDDEYLELLETMPEEERNRFLLGLYSDESDGQAYYAFRRDDHVSDKVVRLPGALYIGMDFNVDPMTAVIFQIVNDEIHVIDEKYLSNSDTYKMSDALIKSKYIGNVIPDSTGKSRKTSGRSDHQILRERSFVVMPTHNPFVTDRVNNINRLLTDGKIKIHPRCKKLIIDLEKVSWKDNKLDQKTDKGLTHISDALGYGAWKLMPIRRNNTARPRFE